MAAEVSSMPVNGNYAPHQGYGGLEQQNNSYAYGNNINASSQQPAAPPSTAGSASSQAPSAPSKDEVGWYFVEQYYTTLSRNPEKVYLFYNKRSQFVSGQETDKVAVCVGQRAINDRIKELGFQDTKVRVTNVDSQASDSNIVIQVIGEISNKSQPHRKFVQTFILATQTNGYFVLNDIFRYLIEEEDEAEQETAPAQEEEIQQAPAAESGFQEPPPTQEKTPEPKTLTSSINSAEVESDAQKVDKQLEEQALDESDKTEEAPSGAVNGVAPAVEDAQQAEDAPVAAPEPAATEASRPETKANDAQVEKPTAPEPTPAASPPKQAPAQPAPAPKSAAPAVPKTWASLAASANKVATPAAPSSSASSQTSSQHKAAPSSKPAAPAAPTAPSAPSAPTPPTAPAAQREESPAASSQDEWTAVGGSHNRQQSRQVNQQQQQQQAPQARGYIKNVYETVKEEELRTEMEKYGALDQCHVSREKNSAFVDWKTPEGYNAAVAANPHVINGERLYVVERHPPRAGQVPYNSRGPYQGGRGGRGGAFQGGQGGRGNAQGVGRGSFQGSRGGRGGPAPRGGATSQHT